jgi:hypothetical protein
MNDWDIEVLDFLPFWSIEELKEFCISRIDHQTKFVAFSYMFFTPQVNNFPIEFLIWIKEQDATVKENTVIFLKEEPDMPRLKHANDVIKLHLNQYKGWTCNAGIESLMINWDGEVHRATCRVGGSLGNVYNGTFVTPSDPIVCDRNFCTCASDIPLTKIKND